jgi:hypothetical protein
MALPCHPGRPPGLPDYNDDFPILSTMTYSHKDHYHNSRHYPRLPAQDSGLITTIANDAMLSTVERFEKRLDELTKHFNASMNTITQTMSDILSQVQRDMHVTSSARPKKHTIVPSSINLPTTTFSTVTTPTEESVHPPVQILKHDKKTITPTSEAKRTKPTEESVQKTLRMLLVLTTSPGKNETTSNMVPPWYLPPPTYKIPALPPLHLDKGSKHRKLKPRHK